ncbi:oxidoreductase [Desulfitobacterium hafniense DP7]|uniref:Oxidoreductase n=2 Tax=Desulfitobacterium TaxID=36853 RepID=G9XP85_DESHA|nr:MULTISPECIES: DV_1555 family C-GCAxxG-C-C protein [Desulfitobacterium]EHL06513.1 oxidoreductase [Desulfitobacterium hafniense DP7]SHN81838.1 C_GCAxxG_C_C family probable redox protein [Desulfitobacterium chlororespirans DSM 11544]
MPVDGFRLFQLAAQGFCCSQILLMIGLEDQGKEAPELIRAMHGLCGGMGRSGATCGVLTGGACLIGLAAGKGTVSEQAHPRIHRMVQEFLEWFEETYGSLLCEDILHYKLEEGTDYPVKCGSTISAAYDKVQELLAAHMEPENEYEEFI